MPARLRSPREGFRPLILRLCGACKCHDWQMLASMIVAQKATRVTGWPTQCPGTRRSAKVHAGSCGPTQGIGILALDCAQFGNREYN
jgi:hypothetical protein